MSYTKKNRILMIETGCLTFFLLISVIYFVTCGNMGDMEYRSWIKSMAWLSTLIGVPVSFVVFIISLFIGVIDERTKKVKTHARLAIGAFVIFLSIYLFVTIFGLFFFWESSFEKEEQLAPNLMLSTKKILLDTNREGGYYEPINFLLKREYKLDDPLLVTTLMEVNYGEKFEIYDSIEGKALESGLGYFYKVFSKSNPKQLFHVWVAPQVMTVVMDDYEQVKARNLCMEYAKDNCPERGVTIEDDDTFAIDAGKLKIACENSEEVKTCAEDIAGMLNYVREDAFFRERKIRLSFYIIYDKEEFLFTPQYATGVKVDADYIHRQLISALDTYEEEEWTAPPAPLIDENGNLTPEGAYEKLYETTFEPNGDKYECTYNAKGNFYAILEEGKETKDGNELNTKRTVVYDRISKNEKCLLFVAYKEYRYENGNEYTTAILNFYAVDIKTGEVFVGDKKAWSELPSAEYKEATGE